MSDPEAAVRARLAALQARLAQPTPPALAGQQEIPVDGHGDHDDDSSQETTQPALW